MHAPDFWRESRGLLAWILSPLSALYGAVARYRLARAAPSANIPAIAIGGLTLGGDGKTPLALALASVLMAQGERPAFLTRGFGRRRKTGEDPFVVDLSRDSAKDAGDEALLLAQLAPTIVCADRKAGARLAEAQGASILLMDDGLHSRRLEPDLAILVVDADYGAGNGFCPPSGPLRAPLAAQLSRADLLVLIGKGEAFTPPPKKLVLRARFAPASEAVARLKGTKVFAFAGIGRPGKFAATLREIGADLVGFRWFPDHHAYSSRDLASLAREAERRDALLVTTQKDSARIGSEAPAESVPVKLEFDQPGAIEELLTAALLRARAERMSRRSRVRSELLP
ncbi:MAG: tetraacyldisaccharide 4'-kinase [Methylocystis sp.]